MPAVNSVCRPFAALLLCGACGLGPAGSDEDRVPLARTSQPAIEDLATRKPFPRYPAASLGNGTAGVAVASILIGFDGRMERVDVLEAPDPHVADAVRDALGQWVLPPIRFDHNPGVPYKGMATMVFYFLIEEGEGRVVSGPVLAAERSAAEPSPRTTGPRTTGRAASTTRSSGSCWKRPTRSSSTRAQGTSTRRGTATARSTYRKGNCSRGPRSNCRIPGPSSSTAGAARNRCATWRRGCCRGSDFRRCRSSFPTDAATRPRVLPPQVE